MLLPCVRHAQITTFATCLAQASSNDANYAAAMVALEQAEREVSSCKISFPPRIAVVDRKMRVVSGRPRFSWDSTAPVHRLARPPFHARVRQLDACMRAPRELRWRGCQATRNHARTHPGRAL